MTEHTKSNRRTGIAVIATASDGSIYSRTVGYLDDQKRFPLHAGVSVPLGELTMEVVFHALWLPRTKAAALEDWNRPLAERLGTHRVRDARVLKLTVEDAFGQYFQLPPYLELATAPFPASRRDEALRRHAFATMGQHFEDRDLAAALVETWIETIQDQPAADWIAVAAKRLGVWVTESKRPGACAFGLGRSSKTQANLPIRRGFRASPRSEWRVHGRSWFSDPAS